MSRSSLLLLVMVLFAACSPRTAEETESAERLPIQVDATDADRQISLLSFFPADTVARPGDSLRFHVESIGEPHTVTLGTLVDAGLNAFDEVRAGSIKEAFLGEPEEMFKLPSVFGPAPTYKPENQAAGQPCYLDSGEPPVADACPQVERPAFDGRQAFHNSGLLADSSRYEVRLADDIKPGVYRFLCLIHRGAMQGRVTVLPAGEDRPGPAEVTAAAEEQIARSMDSLESAREGAAGARAEAAVAGFGSGERPYEMAMTFGPAAMTVERDQPVTWSLLLCHTITFNPPAEAFGDLHRQPDGSIRLNPLAYASSQAPPPPELSFDPNAPPIRFDAGSWNGSGFFNSGGMCSLGMEDLTYTLRFSQPGDYQLRCLFHPFMRGTIKVV